MKADFGWGYRKKVAITTLGCKVNQYESCALAGEFRKRGYEVVPFGTPADIYVINTCTVTGRSDYQSRQLIRRAFRANPGAIIVATGCYAQVAPEELAVMPEVSLIVGNDEKLTLPERIEAMGDGNGKVQVGDIWHVKHINFRSVSFFPDHTRAFLKIQDGCNACCSYCIVPTARGRSRSLPRESVLTELRRLGQSGYQEVVLTGIHLGAYGQDLPEPMGLLDMLKAVEKERPVSRIRLSSLEPAEISDELVDWVGRSNVICPHFHVPLQSGDDDVLQSMRRAYDRAFFHALIEKIRAKVPRAAIGVDVMTGFPGEDEAAFQNTFDLIASLPLTYLHVFPYSRRHGTAAAVMEGQVEEKAKRGRAEALRLLGAGKKEEFARSFVGAELPVLIEGYGGRDKKNMRGWTDNYLAVIFEQGNPDWINQIVPTRILDEERGQLRGRVNHA
ncbi:MAG: tRNA (N(6)-L-threonylcarbamoyladenosine(37)-C(2))-methylthiotransferase MtaB [Deltaproteobacteria bacterium]|jgi:threonylcarbamoyladenosine tRNA methylthiotransferase MtaB|nr:tRNA (N(6)-L-threonylcarbamoyladenosine(37)-C(2))-methylthiotransferase MtaB [Deltaproteobacteria bacterium]